MEIVFFFAGLSFALIFLMMPLTYEVWRKFKLRRVDREIVHRLERIELQVTRLALIEYKIEKIWALLKPAGKAARMDFFAIIDGKKVRISDMKQIKVDQTIACSVEFLDKKGNPAKVDGVPKWGVSDEGLASLAVAEDGMSAVLTPSGKAGSVKIMLTADADLGEGVKEISGESEEIVIVGLEAVSVALKLGEPADMPEGMRAKKK